MRPEARWIAAIAAAIAAIGVTSQHSEKPPGGESATAQTASQQDRNGPATESDISLGPCAQIENHLKSFLGLETPISTLAPSTCFGKSNDGTIRATKRNKANERQDALMNWAQGRPIHLSFMIATLPDPTHTHFPLVFDRMSEAIQQGASDEGYVYDSSWLPWVTKDSTFGSLQDQDSADSRKEAQEEQPGILLFRRKPGGPPAKSGADSVSLPYQYGLIVFIVGEEPTQGIHRDQFKNATAWIAALQTNEPDKHRLPPTILAPSFSGSVYSLADLLSDPEIEPSSAPSGSSGDERLRIYSGMITGNKAMAWITKALESKADFASFQRSDGFVISRYCEYLTQSKFDLSRLAILSEDQTAYGSEVTRPRAGDPDAVMHKPATVADPTESSDAGLKSCNLDLPPPEANGTNSDSVFHQPLRVYYPRDISALRAAYQSESIFSAPPSSPSNTGQRTLAPDIADPEGNQHDSIRAYSGDQKALSQEAVLQQIVSELRVHQSEYILLRSSNVLDQIFLSHYLRLGYPQGRIVILGADQLLRRESGAARLSGIMTLTTYPLTPWEPHWTQRLDDPSAHSHRVFAQDRSEGVYVATRALLHFPVTLAPGDECHEVVKHLAAAGYTIDSTGTPGSDPQSLCNPKGNPTPVSIHAWRTETVPGLKITFESGDGGSYHLESIETGVEKTKNDRQETKTNLASFPPGFLLPLPSPPLAGFVPVNTELIIPDYRAPFWIDPPGSVRERPEQPVAWLSVLGRNDFWPLAALTTNDPITGDTITTESIAQEPLTVPPPRGFLPDISRAFDDLGRAFLSLFNVFTSRQYGSQNSASSGKDKAIILRWLPMPVSVRIVLATFLIGCAFHFLCCFYPSVTQKPSLRAYFVCVDCCRLPHLALMVLGSVTISAMATVLAWGFGAMSPDGAPLESPCIWLLSQPFFWSVACLALAVNVSKQSYAPSADPKAGPGGQGDPLKRWSLQGWKKYFDNANGCKQKRLALWGSVIAFLLGTLAFYLVFYLLTERVLTVASRIPTYWRSMDFTDGVSPVTPLLAIGVGVYLWFWYSLQGLALLGRDRPHLPQSEFLAVDVVDASGAKKKDVKLLRMFSEEGAAKPVEGLCGPFAPKVLKKAVVFFALQILLVYLLGFRPPFHPVEVPLRSLGARAYSILICWLMDLLFSIMMANAWQLVNVWRELRSLLTHLDRIPLRRSMAAFPGVSWNSVWTVSGNVLDLRYQLLTSELRCVAYLKNCLAARNPLTLDLDRGVDADMNLSIQEIQDDQLAFARWYSDLYNEPDVPQPMNCNPDQLDQQPFEKVQEQLANFAGFLMSKILVPAWREEKGDQSAKDIVADGTPNQEKDGEELTPVSQLDPHIRHAEQLVCYVYLGFIQNVLGRMRSLAMCILLPFIAATIAMASYPFDPRPTISGAMVLLFAVLAAAIVFVYAQVHRDPILSLVTKTKPGELGGDFWLKILGFGVGPVLGLLTTLFPQLTDFVFSWVQPSLTSIK